MKEGSGISDAWILEYVVPHIAMQFSGSVALVVGRDLIWVAFEDFGVYLPQVLRNWIQTAYADIPGQQLEPGENLVKKCSWWCQGMKEKSTLMHLTMMTTMMGMGHQGDNDNTRGMNSWDSTHRWLH
jgi:hypothetical protein